MARENVYEGIDDGKDGVAVNGNGDGAVKGNAWQQPGPTAFDFRSVSPPSMIVPANQFNSMRCGVFSSGSFGWMG